MKQKKSLKTPEGKLERVKCMHAPAHQRFPEMEKTWKKTFGGASWDEAWSLVETSDGGYALAGYTSSFGAGTSDFWLRKTDAYGTSEMHACTNGLIITEVNANTLSLYRSATDRCWNYVRVRIWKIKDTP